MLVILVIGFDIFGSPGKQFAQVDFVSFGNWHSFAMWPSPHLTFDAYSAV